MMPQPETRKYQLFPKGQQLATMQGEGLDPEQAFALAMGQHGDKADRHAAGSPGSLRLRIQEHNRIRRRKVSVPELGPMTTVHESTMDSPTIPGRSACHERSISAPGSGWKQHHLAHATAAERTDADVSHSGNLARSNTLGKTGRQPQSSKSLPPLVIPAQTSSSLPRLTRQLSLSRLRSGSTATESSIRSARTDDSPKLKTPYTPSQTATTPFSASTSFSASTASTLPTPVSASMESRVSPKPWRIEGNTVVVDTSKEQTTDMSHNANTPKSASEPRPASSAVSHRRNPSESNSVAGTIMDRGRPRKKSEGLKRSGSKRSKSAERRAFENLPKGWKVPDAVHMLGQSETAALHKQALQQAARFEMLRKEDVDSLSRELRNLDERTEYLRRTYHSLRAGRRNLHSRICQYLRSPRMAVFSQESMLKQEEALAELDGSIDDWVNKLEQAENRRTRVRQKLLEHVAAAVTVPSSGVVGVSESLQIALGVAPPPNPTNLSTPPHSPTKRTSTPQTKAGSPSPQRVVAQVPSTILEQPVPEEAAAIGLGINQPDQSKEKADEPLTAGIRRADVESIRIYAGDEVAALLADVEQQITHMSRAAGKEGQKYDEERKELHRAQNHEAPERRLRATPSNSSLKTVMDTGSKPKTMPPTPSVSPAAQGHGEFLLTNAVFRPETATAQ